MMSNRTDDDPGRNRTAENEIPRLVAIRNSFEREFRSEMLRAVPEVVKRLMPGSGYGVVEGDADAAAMEIVIGQSSGELGIYLDIVFTIRLGDLFVIDDDTLERRAE